MTNRYLVKYKVWRGTAIDINYKGDYPANVLSNESNNVFLFDGYECGSMESFLQALIRRDPKEQEMVCRMEGPAARRLSPDGTYAQTLYWQGKTYARNSCAFRKLLRRAYKALFVQNDDYQTALLSTIGKELYCTGARKRYDVICERLLCKVLREMRDDSHNILLENVRLQNEFMELTAGHLAEESIAMLKDVVEGKKRMKNPTIITCPADKELFPGGFAFRLCITPPKEDDRDGQPNKRQGLMDARVSDTIYTYSRPVAFGTPSFLIGTLGEKSIQEKIASVFINGYDFLTH